MSKEKTASPYGGLLHFLHFGLYKRNQGRITRQVSFAVMALVILLATIQLNTYATKLASAYVMFILGLGVFICYRVVNMPRFADFLISVEAEMNKVSWPSQAELIRSSIVVIVVIFFLALTLFVYDLTWSSLFKIIVISAS